MLYFPTRLKLGGQRHDVERRVCGAPRNFYFITSELHSNSGSCKDSSATTKHSSHNEFPFLINPLLFLPTSSSIYQNMCNGGVYGVRNMAAQKKSQGCRANSFIIQPVRRAHDII